MVYTLYGVRLPTVPFVGRLGCRGSRFLPHRRNVHFSFCLRNQSYSWKILAGKSLESGSQSSIATSSEKVLVPGTEIDDSSSREELEVPEILSDDSQISDDVRSLAVENEIKTEEENLIGLSSSSEATGGEDSASVQLPNGDGETEEGTSDASFEKISNESAIIRERVVPPPGFGQRIYEIDPFLNNHRGHLDYRYEQYKRLREAIDKYEGGLEKFSRGYEKFGFTRSENGITYREWAPGAKISDDVRSLAVENEIKTEEENLIGLSSSSEATGGEDSASVQLPNGDGETEEGTSDASFEKISNESAIIRERVVPPPGFGQRIYEIDPFLNNHRGHLDYRYEQYKRLREAIDKYEGGLEKFSRGYEKFGFTRSENGITYREWAPGAKWATLIGDFNNWNPNADTMTRNEFGVWEVFLPNNVDGSPAIPHGSKIKIRMETPSGIKDSIPAWIKFSVQDPGEIPYNGIYYDPPEEEKYVFKHPRPNKPKSLRIYESHVGMSSPEPIINTYAGFRDDVLPRIKKLGYNAVQIMAIQEHSYYASFGYHVTNFFAPSSRFGTPEELKSLIDKAHELGLLVLMDIVHSHASNNTLDGLNMFDGTDACYFHSGARGYHWIWDSRLFNYGRWEVLRFLLSNARWWLDEYKFDGFRFDGVTSMMYTHHGLEVAFTGNYNEYFGVTTDVDAVAYLMLVNDLIHGLFPNAITIGEDVSGMPTFCIPIHDGGVGFDYRLHMAVADKWVEILKDEHWNMGDIVHSLTNRRWLEKCVVYAESHDQALVGDKTIAFWLMDKDMYDCMALDSPSTPMIDRGIALHKMIRLVTMGLGGEGYLNFMGNEFGHSEWIDFPRGDQLLPDGRFIPGNGNSYDKCRRRFDLGDAHFLRYNGLQEFDRAMQHLEEKHGFMTSEHQYISRKHEGDKVIVFERGELIFVFNFHWTNSYSDYRVGCLNPGKYKVVLDSDDPLFGGFGRISRTAEYFTSECGHDDRPRSFLIYAPSRTAVVYALERNEVEAVDI